MGISPLLVLLVGLAVVQATTATYPPLTSDIKNIVETRVLVDRWAVEGWQAKVGTATLEETEESLEDYITSAYGDLNSIFKGLLSSGINVEMRIMEILFILDEPVIRQNPEGSGQTKSYDLVDGVREWLSQKSLSSADHTMLLTGLDLCSYSGCNTKGNARIGGMDDDGWSISGIEFLDGSLVNSMSHEVGHSLGADHDEGECHKGYIMSGTVIVGSQSLNQFRYSPCSIDQIKTLLGDLHYEKGWLSEENTDTPPISSVPLGQRYNADQTCRLFGEYGAKSELCRYHVRNVSDICKFLWCRNGPESWNCDAVRTAEGLVCGNGKRCSLGECVPADDAPAVPDTCPQGEASLPNDFLDDKTCSEGIPEEKAPCVDFEHVCCESCPAVKSDVEDCPYGDVHPRCHRGYCKDYRHLCCDTCEKLGA